MLALGWYSEVGLADARRRALEARRLLMEGRDPSAEKRAQRERARIAGDTSFEAVARVWLAKVSPTLAESTRAKQRVFLERDVFP